MPQQTPLWIRTVILLPVITRLCSRACLIVPDGEAYSIGGDAVITVLLPLHHGENCDKIGMTEVQVMEATKLAIQRVNELDLVPGVSIGLRVVDTCGDVSRSVKLALASLASDAGNCQPTLSLGFLGPEDAASASAVGRATRALQTPVIGYSPRPVSVPNTLDLVTPAPQRSAQAAVQVLGAINVASISIVHTDDEEGRILAEHFNTAAEDAHRCVEMVLEAGDEEAVAEVLREGPGSIVILGTREKAQSLARTLGAPGGPAELILLLDNAGPLPAAALAGVEIPVIILQRTAPTIPEFLSFLERDLLSENDPRREYVAAMSSCDSCSSFEFGYDARAPAAMAAVLIYVEALREAQVAYCGTRGGLCNGIKGLDYQGWQEKLSHASFHAAASTAFPNLKEANFGPGSEDIPRFAVKFMPSGSSGNITQVGHADASSAVLGQVDTLVPKCGIQCPCPTPVVYSTTKMPELLPAPDNITAPTRPPTGFSIMGGEQLWGHKGWWPKGFTSQTHLSKMEVTTYLTAFTFIIVVFFASSLICIYNLQKAPPRR